ncbi:MAG: DUF4397 domain-containing protein [Flavobacteriales bacterium]
MKHARLLSSLATGALLYTAAIGQEARLQVVHNCPDLAAEVVDVYVNGDLFLDDFRYRTARGFTTVPAGVELNIAIAPGTSTSVNDALYTEAFTLAADETYLMVASGTVFSNYMPYQPFSLEVFAGARESASGAGTDVLVMHGSTDAPTVDVYERALANSTIVDDINYPEFAGYLELATEDYILDVRTADGMTTLASYSAPLATLGLQGKAIAVFASGFLDPSMNNDGEPFGLWVALSDGGDLIPLPFAPAQVDMAKIQVIHNSADAAAAVVDIYVNDVLTIPDVAFRTATPFLDVPAGVDLAVGIAPGNSTGAGDIIATFDYNLAANGKYIIVANGIVSGSGYNPNVPFGLNVFDMAREEATDMMNTDVLVIHGSTDAPTVDVAELAFLSGATVIDDLEYGSFAGYLELGTADYILQVQTSDGTPVQTYGAPLATLGLDGAALTVVASGFLDPMMNSNGADFGLWVALASGGELIPLPIVEPPMPMARVQIIHNSADAAAATVDIYVNDAILLEDVAFRTATPFLDVPAGVDLAVGIAPGNSTGAGDIIATFDYNLADGGSYIIVANGIVSGSGYNPSVPFDLNVFDMAREAATDMMNTDVLVIHGSTDAPTVDVAELAFLDGATVIDDLEYGTFAGYLELGTADYALQVQTADGVPVATYSAPLATLGLDGAAITVVASGFLDPMMNSNGSSFGLWVALADGGALVPLPLITNVGLNELEDNALAVSVWPNPANDMLNISVDARDERRVNARMTDMTGRVVIESTNAILNAGENRLMMDLNGLSQGMYTLSLMSEQGIRTIPVQVSR